MHKLFKQICTEEAKALNEFWINSTKELDQLKIKIKEAEIKKKKHKEEYHTIYAEIDKVLHKDGYIGNYSDVIEYFSRTNLNFSVKNCYFDIQHELKTLYNALPTRTNELQKLQEQYDILVMKRQRFTNITEEILINSILMAFQKLIPENNGPDILDTIFKHLDMSFRLPKVARFPWNIDVNEDFVNYDLVNWYRTNIDDYLKVPVRLLKQYKREVLFK